MEPHCLAKEEEHLLSFDACDGVKMSSFIVKATDVEFKQGAGMQPKEQGQGQGH